MLKRLVYPLVGMLLSISVTASNAGSAALPPAAGYDARLKTVDYDPAAVVRLEGCQNFQTMITLAPDEHVENVGVGDAAAWQVTPNKRGNLLFVKAIAAKGYTNMTVVSDKRSYSFELRTAPESDCTKGRVTYELRFR